MIEEILADPESVSRINRKYPHKPSLEHYRLCQWDVFNRLSGGVLSSDASSWHFPEGRRVVTVEAIREHNRKMLASGYNLSGQYRDFMDQALE